MIFPEKGKECIEISKIIKKLASQPFEKIKCNQYKKAAIINYEVQELTHFLVYDAVSQEGSKIRDEEIHKPKESLAKMGMGDLLIQLRFIAYEHGWDFDSIQRDALNHRIERQKEIEESY